MLLSFRPESAVGGRSGEIWPSYWINLLRQTVKPSNRLTLIHFPFLLLTPYFLLLATFFFPFSILLCYSLSIKALKLRAFSRRDLLCIGIYCNTLLTHRLWFLKTRNRPSGGPRIRKKACSLGLIELNVLVCVSVFRPSGGFLTKDHVVKPAGNLSFLQLLRF